MKKILYLFFFLFYLVFLNHLFYYFHEAFTLKFFPFLREVPQFSIFLHILGISFLSYVLCNMLLYGRFFYVAKVDILE
ncbi:MAG: hypothetical protein H7A25_08930 [Leptospiraceae bacterium]|nr:hypothetical protein [Leptospiraceae bacterium]MCP5500014.1 hypothetical protein [Leptospiraceae bacterium]